MKKVRAKVRITRSEGGWNIYFEDPKMVVYKCLAQWKKDDNAYEILLEAEIKSPFQFKTNSQLGYLHACLLPAFHDFALEAGNEWSQEQSKTQAKILMDFVEERRSVVNGDVYYDVKSFANASKEEVSEFIDKLIRFLAEYGVAVESPYDYRKRLGITQFDEYE